jgi:hypothetical protein
LCGIACGMVWYVDTAMFIPVLPVLSSWSFLLRAVDDILKTPELQIGESLDYAFHVLRLDVWMSERRAM